MAEAPDVSSAPEQPEGDYSGPYLGDVRDPVPIRQLIHSTLDKLDAIGVQTELDEAMHAHRQLIDPELRGSRQVTDEELQAAAERLSRAQLAARHLNPPQPE